MHIRSNWRAITGSGRKQVHFKNLTAAIVLTVKDVGRLC